MDKNSIIHPFIPTEVIAGIDSGQIPDSLGPLQVSGPGRDVVSFKVSHKATEQRFPLNLPLMFIYKQNAQEKNRNKEKRNKTKVQRGLLRVSFNSNTKEDWTSTTGSQGSKPL